jgi:hypothetical protein
MVSENTVLLTYLDRSQEKWAERELCDKKGLVTLIVTHYSAVVIT